MKVFSYKDKLFTDIPETDTNFSGHCPVNSVLPAETPELAWRGPKIALETFDLAASFLLWSQEETKNEAQVRLYLGPDNVWAVEVLPQHSSGMSTDELDTKEREEIVGQALKAGFKHAGSIHHHCTMSAFQSGTDKNDEEVNHGVHITLGKMDDKTLDSHARVCYNGFCVTVQLVSLIDFPPKFVDVLAELSSSVAMTLLPLWLLNAARIKATEFPYTWKERIKKVSANVTGFSYGYRGGAVDDDTVGSSTYEDWKEAADAKAARAGWNRAAITPSEYKRLEWKKLFLDTFQLPIENEDTQAVMIELFTQTLPVSEPCFVVDYSDAAQVLANMAAMIIDMSAWVDDATEALETEMEAAVAIRETEAADKEAAADEVAAAMAGHTN